MFISAQKTVTDLIEDKIKNETNLDYLALLANFKDKTHYFRYQWALQDNWRISDRKHVQRFQNRWGGFTDVRARC
jgi:hypothetical protein